MDKNNEQEKLKQITLYDGISKNNKVSKSREWMCFLSKMSINQLKLLDIFLSRIDPQNPEKSRVVFSKKEFEKMLGIDRIRNEKLVELLQELADICSISEHPEDIRRFKIRPLFSEIISDVDEQTDEQYIVMEINEKEKTMFFNIQHIGYAKYRLANTLLLDSAYSIRMFSYLQYNSFRISWSEEIDELKKILGCEKEKAYAEYKFFNSRLLNKVCDEINKKTSLKYTYSHRKRSSKIEFTIIQVDKMVFLEDNPNEVNLHKEIANIFKGMSVEHIKTIEQELLLIDSDILLKKYKITDLKTAQINLLNDLNNEYIKEHPNFENNFIKSCIIGECLKELRSEE